MPTNDLPLTLLDRYLAGECSLSETEHVSQWLALDPGHRERLQEVRVLRRHVSREPVWDTSTMWRNVAGEIADEGVDIPAGVPVQPVSKRTPTLSTPQQPIWRGRKDFGLVRWLVTGTGLVLAIGAGIFVGNKAQPDQAIQRSMTSHTVTTVRGQRAEIQLPDGTIALLGPDTRLRYTNDFIRSSRVVDLQGEALFTVTHSAKAPFTVRTRESTVRVLGTTFAVRRYGDDTLARIMVVDGRVVVTSTDPSQHHPSILLSAGEGAQVSSNGTIHQDARVNVRNALAWTSGRLDFTYAPFRAVLADVARLYDLDLRIGSPVLGTQLITGAINDSLSPSDALAMLADMVGGRIERRGKTFTFLSR